VAKRNRDYVWPLALFAGCGLLVLVLLAEWAFYRNRQAELKTRLAEKVEVHLRAAAVGQKGYELPGLEAYPATVERPLFMESRRPAEQDSGQPEVASAVKSPLTLKLKGVLTAPDQIEGLFVDAKGKYSRLRKNGTIDGWKLMELNPTKAVLEQDGSREELKLFEPKPKKKAQAPGMAPPQPIPGQHAQAPGFPPQPAPPSPEMQPPPMDNDQPNSNEPVDEPPEEPPHDQ